MIFKCVGGFLLVAFFPVTGLAAVSGPNLQQMHALHEQELVKQQKQQQAQIFKKQRDDLLTQYKALLQAKDDMYNQMKISERDYKMSCAKFNNAQQEKSNLERQVSQLQKNNLQIDKKQLQAQLQKLQQAENKVFVSINNFSRIQQASYDNMQNADAKYRNFTAKEQILKQQIESAQRQLQFVLSQP